jgi:hypothetical protein
MARNALAASSAATMPAFRGEQDKRPVLNGRPSHNHGPPVGLFHPVFNSFQAMWKSRTPPHADAKMYTAVKGLFKASADIYATEEKRARAIDRYLTDLIGLAFLTIEAPGVKSDGVVMQSCGISTAYLVIRDINNEIGMGNSDPYNQGSLAYRKYWAGTSRK